jgi:F-type H+-transporting ATPase subunit epsilon
MKIEIITPQGIVHEGEVHRVQFCSTTGWMEVLDGHAPLIAELRPGKVVTDAGDFECGAGVVKVKEDNVRIVCE